MSETLVSVFAGVDFERGRLFDTTDLDEVRLLCGRVLSPHDIRVGGSRQRLHARMEHLPLGGLSLSRLKWGAAVEVDPDRLASYYLLSLPLQGHAEFSLGGRVTTVTPRTAGIVSAAQRFHFGASPDFEQIVLRLERGAVEAGWEALCGRPPTRPIDFDCAVPVDGAGWRSLAPLLQMLARSTQTEQPTLRFVHARLEEMLVNTLLLQQPHSEAPHLACSTHRPVPTHVKRAIAFMEERLEQVLTVSDVARACGISIRTLQAGFSAELSMGPMQWLRDQRLQAVRDALLSSRQPAIAQTAARFGFTHLGEFARHYRRKFGETPSRSLSFVRRVTTLVS
jgi:AraC-like DNA-binding protein